MTINIFQLIIWNLVSSCHAMLLTERFSQDFNELENKPNYIVDVEAVLNKNRDKLVQNWMKWTRYELSYEPVSVLLALTNSY